jgi:uncharacterized protein Veg
MKGRQRANEKARIVTRQLHIKDKQGQHLCALSLATEKRTKNRFITLDHGYSTRFVIPFDKAYEIADALVAIAEATEENADASETT